MKKKRVKGLNLKKRTISNLNGQKIKGQDGIQGGSTMICTSEFVVSLIVRCFIDDDDTITPSRGCETDGCEQTFTCADWSCACL